MMKRPSAEQNLLLALKSGDKFAFQKLYDQYKRPLAQNFLRLLKADDLAQDALQELFIKVWNLKESLDPDKSFQAFLFKIAQNMVFDFYRKAARDKKIQLQLLLESNDFYSHIEENLVSKENIAFVNKLINNLPVQQQKVFKLFKIEEKSYLEISALLGISTSTINKHIYTANKTIKQQILSRKDLLFSAAISALLTTIK